MSEPEWLISMTAADNHFILTTVGSVNIGNIQLCCVTSIQSLLFFQQFSPRYFHFVPQPNYFRTRAWTKVDNKFEILSKLDCTIRGREAPDLRFTINDNFDNVSKGITDDIWCFTEIISSVFIMGTLNHQLSFNPNYFNITWNYGSFFVTKKINFIDTLLKVHIWLTL